ncbi:MAG: J domain-containing protein [Planctomycetes bacterium]|nr:J domain-containing protein [Planctomycetota bacterium]
MAATRDYYEVLGVGRTAAPDDIRAAYRRLARKYHPDLNPGNKQAEQHFKQINEAYEVLSDPEKRRMYDQFGPDFARAQAAGTGAGAAPGGGPGGFRYTWSGEGSPFDDAVFEAFGGGGGEPANLFEELLGRLGATRGRARRAAFRGQDVEAELAVAFEQAVRGGQAGITLERPAGDGSSRPERIQVRIPPGVRDGQRLRLRGQGGPGAGGGPPGDLYLLVRVQPHPYFRREEQDIYIDVPVTVAEAALGAAVEVPTLGGRTRVRIPPGTAGGTRLRLRGQGVPGPSGGGAAGDQYCVIKIVPPRTLDERQRRLFEQLKSLEKDDPRAEAPWNR